MGMMKCQQLNIMVFTHSKWTSKANLLLDPRLPVSFAKKRRGSMLDWIGMQLTDYTILQLLQISHL